MNPVFFTSEDETQCFGLMRNVMTYALQVEKNTLKVDEFLWELKYKIFGSVEEKFSQEDFFVNAANFICSDANLKEHFQDTFPKIWVGEEAKKITFRKICQWLHRLELVPAATTCYERVWALDTKKSLILRGVKIDGIHLSVHSLLEIRKIQEELQQEVIETAIADFGRGKRITAENIKDAAQYIVSTPTGEKQMRKGSSSSARKTSANPQKEDARITLTPEELENKIAEAVRRAEKDKFIGLQVAAENVALKNHHEEIRARMTLARAEGRKEVLEEFEKILIENDALKVQNEKLLEENNSLKRRMSSLEGDKQHKSLRIAS